MSNDPLSPLMITPDVLLSLGCTETQLNQYQYRGIPGQLFPESGMYQFSGLSLQIPFISDLKFMLSLIDQPEVD
ncbi:hypothetical protein [Spirosoma sp. KNUC1025]|uniref:hypothetical protein n=1 Tax=Spirosoma sp. KNUC1025 TaxID=2894082 RepID=UPI00386777CA|nr:hypothetical protein LN737_15190 [Spirosoma sp. KNUC1025]